MKKENCKELSKIYISEAGLLKFGSFIIKGLINIKPIFPGNYYYHENIMFIS
jgi:hypothetical protein